MDAFSQLENAVRDAAQDLPGTHVETITVPFGPRDCRSVKLHCPPDASAYFIAPDGFPDVPAVLTVNWGDGSPARFESLEWDANHVGASAMRAIAALVSGQAPFRAVYGDTPDKPLTLDPDVAARMGWRRLLSGHTLEGRLEQARPDRIDPNVVAALGAARIVIFGTGSVGSYVAEHLARTGIGGLGLIDPDVVEAHNLTRTAYEDADIGTPKVNALERRLRAIVPELDIAVHEGTQATLGSARVRQIFEAATLIVVTTDSPKAQNILSQCANAADRPAVFIGLYRGANGGEVIYTIPKLTGCLTCATGGVRNVGGTEETLRDVDYGTGRLEGEVALASDIQFVSAAALKIIYGLVCAMNGAASVPLAQFVLRAASEQKSAVLFSTTPDYWGFPDWMSDAAGQFAFQSVWVTVERNEDCVRCGSSAEGYDPFDYLSPTPTAPTPIP